VDIITNIAEMQQRAERLRNEGQRIGVVPTMGYLHEGHLSLIRRAREEADVVVTTIFVNPTQFGPGEDFEQYPRDVERDQQLAAEAGTDILFLPTSAAMYPEGYSTFVQVEGASSMLEGKFRPMHFRGVTTVVAKLFNITKPHVAVFGQKDAQQAFIIQTMARELNMDVRLLVAPIVREADGLAMSSRNVYLSPAERERATALYTSLKHTEQRIQQGERSVRTLRSELETLLRAAEPTAVDYIAFVRPDQFREVETFEPPSVLIALAVRFGSTRLLDNIVVPIS
jgi:pantoate--beta-alanine ligase